ncbi:MAG: sulfite exporter TauE/SafE family protein [Deltaproteobacteria bacterium]|nr:sulfite exporter TauE/SafE family protein [Deltaproteobacteria bacterium]
MDIISLIILGVLAGALSGLVGIGGGIVVVPALVLIFGLSQHQAQGTTLAMMVPPIGLLAAWTYYKAGNADLKVAGFLCIGFFVGGLIGAKTATAIPTGVLKKVFGGALFIVSLRMIFWK